MATSLVSFNTNGCADPAKRQQLFEFLKMTDGHVFLLSETHTTPLSERNWSDEWQGQGLFSHGTSTAGGVAILFSDNLDVDILSSKELLPGRCLFASVRFHGFTFNIINIHAPNQGLTVWLFCLFWTPL